MRSSQAYSPIAILKVIALILIAVGLIVPASVAFGQEVSNKWSEPIPLSSSNPSSWFPDIAVDANGRIHVVWSTSIRKEQPALEDLEAGNDVVMYTSSQDGLEWSDIASIAATPHYGYVTRPALLVDPQGYLHMSYRGENASIRHTRAPLDAARSPPAWRPPRQISAYAYFSRIALDNQGRLHAVYTQNFPTIACAICFHLLYRWSDDRGLSWSSLTDISLLPTGSAKPQILIDRHDNIHVVWESGVGGDLGQLSGPGRAMYAVSYDRGGNWTLPLELVSPGGIAKNVTIGLDGGDALVAVWLGLPDDLIYFQISQDAGRSWSQPETIPEIWGGWSVYGGILDDYSMATDSEGNVHLILVGRRDAEQESLDVLHLTWSYDDLAWSEPEQITTIVGDVPEWPRIAIGEGSRLYVVWFVRDKAHIFESGNGRYQIWYAQSLIPDFGVRPDTRQTTSLTSGQTPSPPSTIEPTRALTAPADQGLPVIPSSNLDAVASESDALLVMLKSLAPVMLFMALITGVVLVRRR